MEKERREPVDSYLAYCSPEFRAFCERFGIAWEKHTRELTVRFPLQGVLEVTHGYLGTEEPADKPIETATNETTTLGNPERWAMKHSRGQG